MARFAQQKRRELENRIRPLIEEDCLQQWKVAEMLGVSEDFVLKTCKRLGLQTQRTGPRSGEGHPNWKGGRYLLGRYWYRYCPEHPHATKAGYVAEHRLVMEGVIGAFLQPQEVVHHIDGNPDNNDPQNLRLFSSNAEHLKHELVGRTPRWSADGLRRMEEAIQRSATLRKSKVDGDQRNQPNDHQT